MYDFERGEGSVMGNVKGVGGDEGFGVDFGMFGWTFSWG